MISGIDVDKLNRRRRDLLVAIASCCIAIPPASLGASEIQFQDMRIVVADDSDATKRIIESLQKRLPGASVLNETSALSKRRGLSYIAVGPVALRYLLTKEVEGPIISAFTSSQAYRSILDAAPKHIGGLTAIYAEPSPADQMRLIAAIYKHRVNVAVLLSERTAYLAPMLRSAAAVASLDLMIEHVGNEENLNHALNQISRASAILAIPDTGIYSPESIRNVLITSYRHNQAVVGFSAGLVKAGALATCYSSIDDIVAQIVEIFDELAATGRLPVPQYPKYFSTVINESVARSLDLIVDDEVKKLARKPTGRSS